MSSIPTGRHMLSGVCEINVPCGYDGEDTAEGILLTIDGKNYCAYTDPEDGYRSYGCFYQDDSYKQRNPFPAQEVKVINDEWDETDENGWPHRGDAVRILNLEDEEIFACGTYRDDDYYPCGFWHYYPEKLPINKKHEQEVDDKKFEDALSTLRECLGMKDEHECRVPEEKAQEKEEPSVSKPGYDYDIDAFIATMNSSKWIKMEDEVRESLKEKFKSLFEDFIHNHFRYLETKELLGIWERINVDLGA